MKKLLLLAAAMVLPVLTAIGQTFSVTPSTSEYLPGGGQITFTVNLAYPTSAAAVSFTAKPPGATWAHVSTGGSAIPQVSPKPRTVTPAYDGDTTDPTDANSKWGWTYQDVPAGGTASFTFTVEYPANLIGSQTIAFGGDYRINNVATAVPVTPVVVGPQPVAPAITSQPASATVASGQSATFTVGVSGIPAPTLQWQRWTDGTATWTNLQNDSVFSGVTTTTLTVTAASAAMNGHRFRAIATNTQSTATSDGLATLGVTSAPAFLIHPSSQAVALGETLTLNVVISGNPAPTLQWQKGGANISNAGRVSGATSASLVITGFEAGDVGAYRAIATNTIGSPVTSNVANVTVGTTGYAGSHQLVGVGYQPGATITVTNTITYPGELNTLSWSVLLPAGWSFDSAVNAGSPTTSPAIGDISLISWVWATPPPSGSTFTYALRAPAAGAGTYSLVSLLEFGVGETTFQVVAKPDPLPLPQVLYHTGDTNQNWKIDVSELTRVISIYNTRFTTPDGKVRTGAYREATTVTIDGFSSDTTRDSTAVVSLSKYHAADYNRNGKIDVAELTRVIALYNTRYTTPDGKVRTGFYKVAPTGTTTVDGYQADLTRAP